MNVLDNSLFDDGSLNCKNFWLNHTEGTDQFSGPGFLKRILEPEIYNEIISLIERRDKKGMRWLDITHYNVFYGGLQYIEVIWD